VTTLRTVPLTGERSLAGRRRRQQAGTGDLVLGLTDAALRLRLGERGHRGLRTPLRGVEIVGGDRVAAREGAHPRELRAREIELCLGPAHLRLGVRTGRGGGLHAGARLCCAAYVEKRRVAGLDARHHRAVGHHGVARLDFDPLHAAGERRRHHVHVAHARLALVTHRHRERSPFGRPQVDGHRVGTEQPGQRQHEQCGRRYPEERAFGRGCHGLTPGS